MQSDSDKPGKKNEQNQLLGRKDGFAKPNQVDSASSMFSIR
jgi:hypothetical protein